MNVANLFHEPDFPEIMILSNQMRPDGKPVGLNDAGQGWHTDMSYSKDIALANVLHAQAVPMRNGKSVGETQFRNMHAAYDELPEELKHKLEGRTATHDFEKFWEVMRQRPGSRRAALTEEQKRKKPPVSQPLVRIHPLTGRKVLYANPGYTMWIDGMDRHESDTILDYLFRHQERADFLYAHHWAVGDVLMWDNIGTVHNAVADYMPHGASLHAPGAGDGDAGLSGAGGLRCRRRSPASASSSPAARAASASRRCARSWSRAATSSWPTSTRPRWSAPRQRSAACAWAPSPRRWIRRPNAPG